MNNVYFAYFMEEYLQERIKSEGDFYSQKNSLSIRIADKRHELGISQHRKQMGSEPTTPEDYKKGYDREKVLKTRAEKVGNAQYSSRKSTPTPASSGERKPMSGFSSETRSRITGRG